MPNVASAIKTMQARPSVSAIIPTFNRATLLKHALDSVYAQTRPPDEVIVVDDGSSDSTRRMIADHFPKVRYLHQQNAGVSAARNYGIQAASGDWLALLDSDDVWLPDKLAIQLARLDDNPGLNVCHSEEIWIRNGRRVNPGNKHRKAGGWIFRMCLPLCAMSPSSVLIHHSVLAATGAFDETLPACEDYDLWLRITSRYPVLFIDQPLIIKYGGHADQLSNAFWGMDRFRIEALKKILTQGHLPPEDQSAARSMLLKKARIYLKGARRRNKQAEIAHYEALCHRYSTAANEFH
jgi:glycosyltransferase involved in cell wall biosynthesis